MIELLVPGTVATGETLGDIDEPLFPTEAAAIARAVDERRAEFRSVRGCARTALARLGLARPALVPGVAGAPSWPASVVGSMTHCPGYRAAAVAWKADAAGIGIDAEPNAPLPPDVLGAVALPDERDHLIRLARARGDVCWDRLLFTIKEAVYKVWYPRVGQWLDFHDVRVRLDANAQLWTASLLHGHLPLGKRDLVILDGQWLADGGLLVAAVVIPPDI